MKIKEMKKIRNIIIKIRFIFSAVLDKFKTENDTVQDKKNKIKIRYDRIILFVVLPVIFTVSVVMIVKSNYRDKSDSNNTFEEFVPVIYLSPSNQKENSYADGGITEAEAMRAVSEVVQRYLENNDVKVFVAEPDATLIEKVDFSNKHRLTAHVAIHSNTGNGIKNMGGTSCSYNSEVDGSRALAEYIYSRVSRLTPTDDHGMTDGTKGPTYFFEVAESRTPCCMIEVEYHDSIGNARWIIENTEEIGNSIAEGIMQYIELARKRHYQNYTEISEATDGEQDQLS